MTLKYCLETGIKYGLETLGECVQNITLIILNTKNQNIGKLLTESEIKNAINQLKAEENQLYSKTNFTKDSFAKDVLEWINIEDDDIDIDELNL